MKNGRAILLSLLSSASLLAGRVTAQTFTTLHSFSGGSDGATPVAGLILSGGILYGTTYQGGSPANGTVFAINTDGTGFTNLHSFLGNNFNDGANPLAGLVSSGATLFGTAEMGGSPGKVGTIFKVNTNGSAFSNMRSFTAVSSPDSLNNDGANPTAGLVLSGNLLYGTAGGGGSFGRGTVFCFNTNGTGFTNLHDFTATSGPLSTNSDGAEPYAGLVLSSNVLYGTTKKGGSGGKGTVFALITNTTVITNTFGTTTNYHYDVSNLHSFTATSGAFSTNGDGATPYAGLVAAGGTLYGTTREGGNWGYGAVFRLNMDGTGFTNLHNFTALIPNGNAPYNNDGAFPQSGLILSGNTLYGTARNGGGSGRGTVFSLASDGTSFTTLHNFAGDFEEGGSPGAGLVLADYILYGTTEAGGIWGDGTVFSLSFAPRLSVTQLTTNLILSWPTNVAGFDYTGFALQSSANLGSSAAWSSNSPGPVVVNGQYTVTNCISGTQRFFRLSR